MSETVAFTGTRRELTETERIRVAQVILALPLTTRIVTGACIGLDAFVASFAHSSHYHVHTIVPADRSRVDPQWLGWCHTFEEMPSGTDYRDRNARIVAESDRLIAFPDHAEDARDSQRSGTWQTIRLARKAGKPVEVHVLCSECRPTKGEAP